MKGKVLGTYTNTFKDGTVSGVLLIERTDVDNIEGLCVQPFNVSLSNIPCKNLKELVGKEVFVADNGFPKYTWVKDMFIF